MYQIRIIASLGLLLFMSTTEAQTLNFNLTGTIKPGVCNFTAADVNLGDYFATDFPTVGSSPSSFFEVPITSQGCDPTVASIHMRVTGTPDAANPALFRGVAGVGIEMRQKIPVRAVVPAGTTVDFSPVASGATYLFEARFKRSATVTAGTVSSPITINVTYN